MNQKTRATASTETTDSQIWTPRQALGALKLPIRANRLRTSSLTPASQALEFPVTGVCSTSETRRMSQMKTVQGILPIIKSITSNCETGQLDIEYAGTHGTLLFRKGRLIHASLGSLNGFQAVNAAVALRFVQYRFDPLASISHTGSISGSERVVLRRFFGIEAAEMEEPTEAVAEPELDWSAAPEPVVPLERPIQPFAATRSKPNRKPIWAALCVAVLVGLVIGAIAFKASLQTSPQTASVAILANTESQPVAPVSKVEVKSATAVAPEIAAATEVKPATGAAPEVKSATAVAPEVKHVAPPVAVPSAPNKRDSNVPNLNGEWRVVNTVQKTGYKSYGNMEVGFRLSINQKGKEFTAEGEKVSENGKTLPTARRTPIHVTGSIDGDNVLATFIEDGRMRRTNGRFVWKLKNDALTGTFVTNAANSSGTSAVTKH